MPDRPFQNPLLLISALLILLLSITAFLATEASYRAVEQASLWVRTYFGYFYLYLGLGVVLLLVGIAFSPLGKIKLGKENSRPEHSLWAWSAMLYSAGMGAGILLRAVQEPVYMRENPPFTSTLSPEILALEFTFYQWGFTPWAFYGLFAMVVGYALFTKGKKVRVSATIERVLPGKIPSLAIDTMTILTTVFGLIAAIGLGTAQINGGLNHLYRSDQGLMQMLALCLFISALAFVSVWKGVNRGIKRLSKLNILLSLLMLGFVFFNGDMGLILSSFARAGLYYLRDFIPMSLALKGFDPGIEFLTDWTFYYWAFWIAWAPFTGIFIARISRGRSLRQLLLGVLLIPSLGTFFWFSAFGTSAFGMISETGSYNGLFENVFSSIFLFFEGLPLPLIMNALTVVLLIGFLVTSVDSAVFVLSMFTDQGRKNPLRSHRLIWSVFILIGSMALLVLGHAKPEIDVLVAAQKLLLITSLPFACFMVFMAGVFLREILHRPK